MNYKKCENCGSERLSSLVINGHSFCNNICYSEWKWKKERGEPPR